MIEVVKQILRSKNKMVMTLPPLGTSYLAYLGIGELSDLLSFGFSYVEQKDHFVSHIMVSPAMAKKVIREIDAFYFTAETPCVGMIGTAQMLITDRIGDFHIFFSNKDQSVVLDLNLHKMEV